MTAVTLQINLFSVIEPEKEKGARAASRKAADAFEDTEDGASLGGRQGE